MPCWESGGWYGPGETGVQWNPADDLLVACELLIELGRGADGRRRTLSRYRGGSITTRSTPYRPTSFHPRRDPLTCHRLGRARPLRWSAPLTMNVALHAGHLKAALFPTQSSSCGSSSGSRSRLSTLPMLDRVGGVATKAMFLPVRPTISRFKNRHQVPTLSLGCADSQCLNRVVVPCRFAPVAALHLPDDRQCRQHPCRVGRSTDS